MFKSCFFLDQLSFRAPSYHEPACQLLLTPHHLWTLLVFFVLPCRRIPAHVAAPALLSEECRGANATNEAVSSREQQLLRLIAATARREIYFSHDTCLALFRGQMLRFLLLVHT